MQCSFLRMQMLRLNAKCNNFCIGSCPSLAWGSFNNYVDQILPNFDPLPPRVDNCGYFTWYPPFDTWPIMEFLPTPSPLFLSKWMTPCLLWNFCYTYCCLRIFNCTQRVYSINVGYDFFIFPKWIREVGITHLEFKFIFFLSITIKKRKVSLLGVDSLWGDCTFIPADWGS